MAGYSADYLGSRESAEIDVRLKCLEMAKGDVARAAEMADFVLGRVVVDGNMLTIRGAGIARPGLSAGGGGFGRVKAWPDDRPKGGDPDGVQAEEGQEG